jgi:uncharacterized protein (DUF2062 family)
LRSIQKKKVSMVTQVKVKILSLINTSLKEGMSCSKISLCIVLGVILGIFPVLGTTTLLCAITAFVFRLNLPLIQLVNYAAYPLQLALIAFFYGAGSRLFTGQALLLPGGEIVDLLQQDLWGSIVAFWDLTLYAIFAWLLTGPFIALPLYGTIKPVVRRYPSDQHRSLTGVKRIN